MKRLWSLGLLCVACATGSAAIVLSDDFTYADGALTNVSIIKWRGHSGVPGEVNVLFGQVELNGAETEDVNAALLGAPYTPAGNGVLYARFTVIVSALPANASGTYFAHFNAGSSQRGRVFLTTSGAAAGQFRIGVANASSSSSRLWPADLNLFQTYTFVMRYAVSNAQATLWIDPVAESNPSIAAQDVASPSSIHTFSWRQESNIGMMAVDNLVVATSFAEAVSGDASPTISPIPNQLIAEGGTTKTIAFAVSDPELPSEWLDVWAYASGPNWVQELAVAGGGSNRTLIVATTPQFVGTNTITICATDGNSIISNSFLLSTVPALLLSDDFVYPDGMLISNAAPIWIHHAGGTGEIQVVNGQVVMGVPFTEDVHALLPFGPFAPDSGLTFYASFRINFSELPGSSGDYIAHFNPTGGRCRLVANVANAAPGKFRLGIANANVALAQQWPADLAMHTNYLVVLRYDATSVTSTLWVNPVLETDPSTNATDLASSNIINAFALRQSASIGKFTVDDLRAGLTFAAVTSVPVAMTPRLRIEFVSPDMVQISWPAAATAYVLQSSSELVSTSWYDMDELPILVGDNYVVRKSVSDGAALYRLRK